MRRSVFDSENMLWKPLGYLGDFIMLSLLWAAFCIPIVTIGSSTTALYDAAVHSMRFRDDSLFNRFFRTFKRELKTGILTTLIWLVVFAIAAGIYWMLVVRLPQNQSRSTILIFYLVLVSFFLLCIFAWVFPTLSRFTFTAGALCATSVRLAFGNILRSAAMAVMMGGTVFLSYRFAIPIMVMPGLVAYVSTFLIEPVFRKYQEKEE